jgi:hypothetical protein
MRDLLDSPMASHSTATRFAVHVQLRRHRPSHAAAYFQEFRLKCHRRLAQRAGPAHEGVVVTKDSVAMREGGGWQMFGYYILPIQVALRSPICSCRKDTRNHYCPVRWLLSADKSSIEYGF